MVNCSIKNIVVIIFDALRADTIDQLKYASINDNTIGLISFCYLT